MTTDVHSQLLREVRRLRIALMYFTRIPVGGLSVWTPGELNNAMRYFPWVGILVGLACSGIFLLLIPWLPVQAVIVLVLVSHCLLTGCFHEDGLADVCDGFGGAFDRSEKMQIMKDSRVGTYGVVGLWSVLMLKFALLSALPIAMIPPLLLLAHGLSRLVPLSVMCLLSYVGDPEESRVKPVAESITSIDLSVAGLVVVPLLWFWPIATLVMLFTLFLLIIVLCQLANRQIGGYTGDYLGFSQQISEVVVYIVGVSLWISA